MRSPKRRLRTGVALEALAPIASVAVAIALTIDPRATPNPVRLAWAGALVSLVPLILTGLRISEPAIVEWITALLVGLAGMGCSEIGGLTLFIPAGFLGLAGVAHFIASRPTAFGNDRGRPQLVVGFLLLPLGAVLGMSFTPLAFLGWAILIAACTLLVIGFRRSRRARTRDLRLGSA